MKEILFRTLKSIVDNSGCSCGVLLSNSDLTKGEIVLPYSIEPDGEIYAQLPKTFSFFEKDPQEFENHLAKLNRKVCFFKQFDNEYCLFLLVLSDKNLKLPKEITVDDGILKLLEEFCSLYSEGERADFTSEHLSKTIQQIDVIAFSSTPDGEHYYFISDNVQRMLGICKEEFVKRPLKFIKNINHEDYEAVRRFLISIKRGVTASVEYRIANNSGQEFYLRHYAYPVFENGKFTRIDGFILDITKEKKSQTLLQKSEERLRLIFETANDFIFLLDFKGNFISVNSIGALSIEYLPNEIIGRHFLEFVADEDKPTVVKSFQQILKSDKITSFNAMLLSKFGKNIVFEINAKPIFENDKVEGMLGIGRDITERIIEQEKIKELNNKFIEANRLISIERDRAKQKISVLEELNRLKNEFVSNISHELRTPLASIIGFSETIDSDPTMPESMKIEFNQIILNEAKRLSKLINDVLDISKIEAGNITLHKTEFDIVASLDEVIVSMNKKAEEKDVVLSVEIPHEEINLYLDKERIEQVFENVISNAIKFTASGGRVAIYAQSFYKEFEVIISDTGIGIPRKDLPFIFQKFYRVSRPGSEIPGTGLGLALVKQIVDLHKGLITVQSEENKGTTFVIKLPKLM